MRKTLFLSALLLATGALAMPVPGSLVQRVQITAGLSSPVGVTHAGDGSGRLFIVEQTGRIRIWDGAALLPTPFLDLTAQVGPCNPGCGERGLLGLAFHPQFAANGDFFVYYTRASDGDIVLARYEVSAAPNVADAGSGQVLLTIEHSSQGNHNGGHIAFGPNDGYLYIGTGDGGGGGDPDENGQNRNSLLGKVLRIDVDRDDFPADPARNYGIPAGNPFAGATAGADEVWDYGLRNPWRFSFDRSTGDLYIGDVGQGLWEEIDFHPDGSPGGLNFGWDCREGAHDYTDNNGDLNAGCGSVSSVDPILEYSHSFGCSVTGGFVYRGLAQSSLLTGRYLYGDFCSGRIWRGFRDGGGNWSSEQLLLTGFGLTSFGEGENGRLYLTYSGGTLHWLSPYTFADVPPGNGFWPFVEAVTASGLSAGCTTGTPPSFCPGDVVTRAQMAIFLLRGREGAAYTPPPATGTVFADVPAGSFAADWIEQLYRDGLTAGCAAGSPPSYCPGSGVQRAEMAVFLLRARYGPTYAPPPARGVFSDVPTSHWAAAWIERLYDEGITAGCGTSPLRYCPTDVVTRGQMAAFLSRTFNLTLP